MYHWIALAGWAAVGLTLWLARRPQASGGHPFPSAGK
jgi:hypothetical protein